MWEGQCRSCRFWKEGDNDKQLTTKGTCRRSSPVPIGLVGAVRAFKHDNSQPMPDGYTEGVWPVTWEIDGCGEHQPKA